MTTTLLQGDCRAILPTLPAGSVQCVVTSPPYYGLRDYGTAQWDGGDPACDHKPSVTPRTERPRQGLTGGLDYMQAKDPVYRDICGKCGARRLDQQIGLEPTPDEYVSALVGVFREVWRVLRDDGTLWLNLGDSYAANGISGLNEGWAGRASEYRGGGHTAEPARMRSKKSVPPGLKPKDLIGIPWMVAFALRADGWYLRSDIIWAKPNPMPESVTDRPTKAHEYIFLLSKSERYYYDADAVRESAVKGDAGAGARNYRAGTNGNQRKYEGQTDEQRTARNRRTVWTVATQPYTGAHFATFPEKLIEPCILAGSAARACEVCGAPWARVVEREPQYDKTKRQDRAQPNGVMPQVDSSGWKPATVTDLGFRPTCACPNDGVARSVVLDPFVGSGTTCRVAERLGRDSIGIDLGYTDLQEKRTDGVQKFMVDLL